MTMPLLLDTCALIWLSQADPMAEAAIAELGEMWRSGHAPRVSPISAWEVGLLVSRGRLSLTMPPARWWDQAVVTMGLEVVTMPPALLIASTQLPGVPPSDPSDRIIAATARELDLRVMTRDEKLLTYGEAGHLNTIGC